MKGSAKPVPLSEVLQSLDFQPPCSVQLHWREPGGKATPAEEKCLRPAAWVGRCKQCGEPFLVCDEHLMRFSQLTPVGCPKCSASARECAGLFRFEPLGW
jgi:hypothetical protein